MTSKKTAIVWFRQDLRLTDNTALLHACEQEYDILPVYILDDENAGHWKIGAAQRWWLYKSLQSLNKSMSGNLIIRKGKAQDILEEIIDKSGAQAVFWNRCYEPWRIKRDKAIKETLKDRGLSIETYKDALLWEPWEIQNQSGSPYKVFTPFYRKGCLQASEPPEPQGKPKTINYADFSPRYDETHLDLLPTIQWYRSFEQCWSPGEDGAHERFDHFLSNGLQGYKEKRNNPAQDHTSQLSPYLHHGEISPREIWHTARNVGMAEGLEKDMDTFCSEIGWREFSYSLLYHFPDMPEKPLHDKFADFPWDKNKDEMIEKWQRGMTGIPMVDAGMRQLWRDGWMHNRVRMLVASLLVKNMMIHWHEGQDWFWDCLVDADLANNAASWQWVAGCGMDAAPYFRIFNPITQGPKFDPDGDYIREYIPELSNVSNDHIHEPWKTDGHDYPAPIVDLKDSRERALDAFKSLS